MNQFQLTKGMRITNGCGDLKIKTFRSAHMAETQMHHIDELLATFETCLGKMQPRPKESQNMVIRFAKTGYS